MNRLGKTGKGGTRRIVPPDDIDLDLVLRAKDGDFGAFESLVTKYQNRVYSLALRITGRAEDAEEVSQATFLSVMEHLNEFRGEAQFSTWIYRIAANRALSMAQQRRHQRYETAAGDDEESFANVALPQTIAPWSQSPEALAGQDETRRILHEALEDLDEKHRAVLMLRDGEGLSTDETAEALGLSVPNAKVRLMRARLMLREILTRRFGDARAALIGHDHHHD